jgi:hypothetical protein
MRMAADMATGPRLSVRKKMAASSCSGPDGESPAGPLQLLAAIFFLTLSLGPLAMSAAIRISVET